MAHARPTKLHPPVDPARDHILGNPEAELALVEFGNYACPSCHAAHEVVADLRDRFGERLRYVFRHRPAGDNGNAQRAADLAEHAFKTTGGFWPVHNALMKRGPIFTQEDFEEVGREFDLPPCDEKSAAEQEVQANLESAQESGVIITPTFFLNGRRYEGPWDENMSVLAVALANSSLGGTFESLWKVVCGVQLGSGGMMLPLLSWINDGLLAIFFLVVGLEIKREFTVGRLATFRSGALPVVAAFGGILVPVLIYLLIAPAGPLAAGWAVPIATDTAFAVAIIVLLGARVPVELRVFLTAAVIIDDLVAIGVIAVFYTDAINGHYLIASAVVTALLVAMNRWGIYRALPYAVLGIVLWVCLHDAGLHATLAGVILALVTPARPPAKLHALMAQAEAILQAETRRRGDALMRHGPSEPAMRALDAIHDRVESPTDKLLRSMEPWSSYVVLPIFALANAGVIMSLSVFQTHGSLMLAIILGLVIGKPVESCWPPGWRCVSASR